MPALSLSKAWDETKAIIMRDGRLFASVALALVALPAAVEGLVSPRGMDASAPWWVDAVIIVASFIALAGQLALIRLALGPSITVGGAITHGIRRMPIYLLAAMLILFGLFIAAIPFALVLAAFGVPLPAKGVPPSPVATVGMLLYVALICFVVVRMLMSAPVASAERVGPLAMLRRSWDLTAGNWWRLFAFLVMIFVAAFALAIAVRGVSGVLIEVALGPADPMSTSALVVAIVLAVFNSVLTVFLAVMLARIYVQLAAREDVAEVFR
ncbi:MAG: hypothetical protein ABI454_02615 [Sphingomicrobium sp.]